MSVVSSDVLLTFRRYDQPFLRNREENILKKKSKKGKRLKKRYMLFLVVCQGFYIFV